MIVIIILFIFVLCYFANKKEKYSILSCKKNIIPVEMYKYQKKCKNPKYGFIPRSIYPDIVKLNNDHLKDLRTIFKEEGGVDLFKNIEKEGGCRYIRLIDDGIVVNEQFKDIIDLIKDIKNLRNASISCLDPKTKTVVHNNFDNYLYRAHIPLYIPNEKSGICVEKECRTWDIDDFLVVDESLMHQVWNDSSSHRVILLLDVIKVKLTKD
jgi:hypothetical protein